MKEHLNKSNYFLALRTVGIRSAFEGWKLVHICSGGNYVRESHWNLSNTQKTPT